MKKLIGEIVCAAIGHTVDIYDDYNTRCFRCGYEWEPRHYVRCDIWFYLLKFRIARAFRIRVVKRWLKCPDCGGRFGRCKDNCMPF